MNTADIISMHPGKQHNFEQAEQLVKHFGSFRHITSVAFSTGVLNKLHFLPHRILKEFEKRSIEAMAANYVDTYPKLELFYKWKRLTKQPLSENFFKRRNKLFQEKVLRQYTPPKVFIGFDTSSEYIFESWKKHSILILDLTIAVPQFKKKLAIDHQLSEAMIQNLTKGDDLWYYTYKRELELADFILCGSDFVKESCLYLGVGEEKLKVIPYGANLKKFVPLYMPPDKPKMPFKIAFIGNVSYRKGADVLLRAWQKLSTKYDNIELHFFGNLQIDISAYTLRNVFFHGFVTQAELIKNLSFCHVSILPTFFEGSSYAIYQSMALGLAVITTENCGSIIKHLDNGMIIKYGSEQQISEALTQLIEERNLTEELGKKAMEDIKRYTWEHYGLNLYSFLSNL